MMNQQPRMILGYAWPHANPGADGKTVKDKGKRQVNRFNRNSEEAAIRTCHKEPTRRNIVIVIACIKTLQL